MVMFDGACWWCGIPVQNYVQRQGDPDDERAPTKASRDHVHARSHGGREAFDNLVLACRRCNQERGALAQGPWRRHLREAGHPPRLHREFKEFRARWIKAEPTWFEAYTARKKLKVANKAKIRGRRKRVRSTTPGAPPQPAGSDPGSVPATGSGPA